MAILQPIFSKLFGPTLIVIGIIVSIILVIVHLVGWWAIYTKMGIPGWKVLIPIYSTYVLYKKLWNTKAFWINLALQLVIVALEVIAERFEIYDTWAILYICGYIVIALALLFFTFKLMALLSVSFGHRIGYTLGLVFFEFIFVLLIGFDDSKYIGDSLNA